MNFQCLLLDFCFSTLTFSPRHTTATGHPVEVADSEEHVHVSGNMPLECCCEGVEQHSPKMTSLVKLLMLTQAITNELQAAVF
eukprot:m.81503 g.81503  ORF g.81503 m.81503 type:complete len:83 (-) comp13368_c0_seq2:151-399(-)